MTTQTVTVVDFLLARIVEDEEAVHYALNCDSGFVDETEAAKCEALRQIVDIHGGIHSCGFSDYDDSDPCDTLRVLALIYSDHPDYQRRGWTP